MLIRPRRAGAAALAACLCLAASASTPMAAGSYVRIVYGPALDRACGLLRGHRIDPAEQQQLQALLPHIREAWRTEGLPVLDQARRRAHQVDRGGLSTITLTLCDLPSSSLAGTIVNMRHALPSAGEHRVSLRYKALVIVHELLHPLIPTACGQKCPGWLERESRTVRTHVRLFALMQAALRDLGREAALAELKAVDSSLPNPAYGRAWQIVDAAPGGYLDWVETCEGRSAADQCTTDLAPRANGITPGAEGHRDPLWPR